MKKLMILASVVVLLLCVSCAKEKNCRCSVLGSQNTRIITIKSESCDKLNYASYHDELDTVHIDSIICTDHLFGADDSLIVEL